MSAASGRLYKSQRNILKYGIKPAQGWYMEHIKCKEKHKNNLAKKNKDLCERMSENNL